MNGFDCLKMVGSTIVGAGPILHSRRRGRRFYIGSFGEVLRVVRIGDWKALPELEVMPSRRAVAVMPVMSVNV